VSVNGIPNSGVAGTTPNDWMDRAGDAPGVNVISIERFACDAFPVPKPSTGWYPDTEAMS
jgi:hypothetical protein